MTKGEKESGRAELAGVVLEFLHAEPGRTMTGADAAELLKLPHKAARALLQLLARGGMLERVDRGHYQAAPRKKNTWAGRRAPQRAAATPAHARPVDTHPPRRMAVMAEELVGALTKALVQECTVSLAQDRDVYVASLNDHKDGLTTAANRTATLAVMDVVGKWQRMQSVA